MNPVHTDQEINKTKKRAIKFFQH